MLHILSMIKKIKTTPVYNDRLFHLQMAGSLDQGRDNAARG
jgi:hypothetical protein